MCKKGKVSVAWLTFIMCVCCISSLVNAGEENWRLGIQAWTFNRFTFYEAIEKTKALGLKYIEAYPGQRLSKEHGEVKFDHNMSAQLNPPDVRRVKAEVLQKLRDEAVILVNYGVVALPNNEEECRKVFNFARDMGIETIVSEPPEDAFDLIDKLCEEYKINVAIHNHPRPSHYWDPNTVLKVCDGRSKRIGACADIGHWMRSGINPVEALKKLEGRIISLHFKDLNDFGNPAAHDVVWGKGAADAKEILAELDRQGFKGVFSIEYEHNWLNSMPEIAECVSFFERTASELGQSDWQWIFNGQDLTGWDGDPRLWSVHPVRNDLAGSSHSNSRRFSNGVKDGCIRGQTTLTNLALNNTFLIWREGKLKDFILKIKFRIENGNSGIQYRSYEFDKWRVSGYQAEVENTPGKVGFLYHEAGRGRLVNVGDFVLIDQKGDKHVVGRVADKDELIKAGYYKEKGWNEYTIIASGNHLMHYLNGYPTMELVDNDRVTNPDDPTRLAGAPSQREDSKGAAREGILALQIHAGPPMTVEFKDIRIKHLKPKYGDGQVIFNGQLLFDWEIMGDPRKSKWVVGTAAISPDDPKQLVNKDGYGEMINLAARHGEGLDIYSKARFGDCRIELELMVPKQSNSGIYVMGEYEVQVLDSSGKTKLDSSDMGAIYGASPPTVNACKSPGQWQKYVIEFQAPRFDATGKKTTNAKFLKVKLNGQLLHENLEMPGPTPGGLTGKEASTGPIMFQGNHGPVAYRNIIIKPLLQK